MRLNWFSPLPPAESEIAHHTFRVIKALSPRAQITLWTEQNEWDPELGSYARIQHYQLNQMPWSLLNQADATIYNIGNHPDFHGAIWQVSQSHPGLVILHELRLQHLFALLYRDRRHDWEGYVALMEQYYGKAGRLAAESFWSNRSNVSELAEHYPLTSAPLKNALGVVVHTREAFNQLKQEGHWPVAYAALPYPVTEFSQITHSSSKYANGPPYRLIIFGHLGANRRLSELLRALADMQERESFRLDVYGNLLDVGDVHSQVQVLRLEEIVTFHGFVPDAELDRALGLAHIAINLRYPSMGEASGSQLRIWDHALPCLVTRTGWYEEISDDAVAFVRPDHETADIQAHLRAFLNDPEPFARKGMNGRRILEEHHTPEAYAQAIVDFIKSMRSFQLCTAAYALADRTGAEMSVWTSPTGVDESYRKVAEEIYALLSLRQRY